MKVKMEDQRQTAKLAEGGLSWEAINTFAANMPRGQKAVFCNPKGEEVFSITTDCVTGFTFNGTAESYKRLGRFSDKDCLTNSYLGDYEAGEWESPKGGKAR